MFESDYEYRQITIFFETIVLRQPALQSVLVIQMIRVLNQLDEQFQSSILHHFYDWKLL